MRVSLIKIFLFVLFASGVAAGQSSSGDKWTLGFVGNENFFEQELVDVTQKCLSSDPKWNERHNPQTLDYCLARLKMFLAAKGYLRASIGKPKEQGTGSGPRLLVPVNEGALYRLGQVKIKESRLLTPTQILGLLTIKTGDIADGEHLSTWLYEDVKKEYDRLGYIQYASELEPNFHLDAGAREGTVDFTVTIDEGQAFTIRTIKFEGNGDVPEDSLRRQLFVHVGDIFNKELFEESLKGMSQPGQFEVIDTDKDVDYRCDPKLPELDLTIHLKIKVIRATNSEQSSKSSLHQPVFSARHLENHPSLPWLIRHSAIAPRKN